jgi:hypothetical protein
VDREDAPASVWLYSSRPRLSRITSDDLPPEGGRAAVAAAADFAACARRLEIVDQPVERFLDAVQLVLEQAARELPFFRPHTLRCGIMSQMYIVARAGDARADRSGRIDLENAPKLPDHCAAAMVLAECDQ